MNYAIAIGADHRGFTLKDALTQSPRIGKHTITWTDVGTYSEKRTDYPHYALEVVTLVRQKEVDLGIMLCGSGIGMAIAANRFRGIYAGVAWNEEVARAAREDDNVTILSLPADFITTEEALNIVDAWLSAQFKQGRYFERLEILDSF